jgi:hypothetical protein
MTEVAPMIDKSINQNVIVIENLGPCKASHKGLSKNALCPYYENCIDWALKENWSQFTCGRCTFQDYRVKFYPDADEIKGFYRLLSRIFIE